MPDSPNLPYEPFNFFLLTHLGKGYIYGATSMLPAVSHLRLLKGGEKLSCLSVTCPGVCGGVSILGI